MSQEIKFTSDGKKVVIVGKLNAQETIVQEIFVSNGSEIPSGENFVVKSLHDAPAISWKEKNLKDLEDRYERQRRDWENKLSGLRKEYESKCDLFSGKINWIAGALKEASPKDFELLVNYITGKVTHIVIYNTYGCPSLVDMSQFNEDYEGKLRLVTFFGKRYDDKPAGFTWGIGQYYDNSGGNTTFMPFLSYDEALKFAVGLIEEKPYQKDSIDFLRKHNAPVNSDKLNEYRERITKCLRDCVENSKKQIEGYESTIAELNKI